MRQVVVDASVIVKWLLPDHDEEENIWEATQVLQLVKMSKLDVLQPPHWLAEAAAVVTQLSPETALEDIEDLCMMKLETVETLEVFLKASELSSRLPHHLFDTLYHAVALSLPDAVLITADERYYHKAESFGQIILLKDLNRIVDFETTATSGRPKL